MKSACTTALALGLLGFGCHPPSNAKPPTQYPGTLVSTEALGEQWSPFMARQKVTAEIGTPPTRTASFEGVLQLSGEELLLVGLTPFGTKAFVVRQKGQHVELETFTDQPLPFQPRDILLDIHRTLFLTVPGAPQDGTVETTRDGERITETWKNGKLLQRRFQRLDDNPPGEITIHYDPPAEPGTVPQRVTLDNAWFDYHLQIETLDVTPLPNP